MTYLYGQPTRTPSRCLEEAADLLRKAMETNEREYRGYGDSLNKGRERIARQFAELAAIEMGVIPASLARDLLDRITNRDAS